MAKINANEIKQSDIRWLALALAPAIEEFFKDEENQKAYEEWKHDRARKVQQANSEA